jgi:transposase-like protein
VERETNPILLYPVSDRTEATLLPIIERHVEKGATIYSDGWSAYCPLNLGYQHFTVLHKYAFEKTYINTSTNEEVHVHTNRIEGAWKHAKDHFRRIAGTKITQFEGHIMEIMWRSDAKSNIYSSFFYHLKSIYPLNGPAKYTYTTPLFETWSGLADASDSQLK